MKYLHLVILLAFLVIPLASHAAPTIVSIDIEGVTPDTVEQVRQVMGLHEGDPWDANRLTEGLANLRKWGRFTSADITPVQTPAGIRLKVILEPGLIVSGIDIYGGYPFLSMRLRRILGVRSGSLYDPALADAQREKLASFFERKGYEGTKVTLEVPVNNKKKTVDLVYRIQRGDRYKIEDVQVTGNRIFPKSYFVSQINPYILYEPGRLRKRLDKIRRDYQQRGYLQARVRLIRLDRDPERKVLLPVLEVSEGRRAIVRFEGNRLIRPGTFRKILPLLTDGGYSDYDIEESLDVLRKYYRQSGFLESDLSVSKRELDINTLEISFHIHEGPQTQVKEIAIEGNHDIRDRTLRKDLATKESFPFRKGILQEKTIDFDMKNLPRFLQSHGALDGKALGHSLELNTFRDKAKVTFRIDEGLVRRVRGYLFEGISHVPEKKLRSLLSLRPGEGLNRDALEQDKKAIVSYYANHGHPYATVAHDESVSGADVTIRYRIQEGLPVVIGEVLIVGNERTLPAAVRQSLLLKKGDPFNYRKVLESETSLRKTNAFRGVTIETIGLAEKKPVVHLLVKLEEFRKILLDFGATFDTDDGFTGNLSLTHVNLFGTAKSGILKLTGGRDLQKGEAILKDTHFLGMDLEGSLSAIAERRRRPGFTTVDGGGAISFLKDFSPRLSLLGRYEVTRTFFSDVTDDTGLAEEDHTTSLLSLSLNYDRRDSFSDPTKGFVAFAGLDVSNKLFASAFNYLEPNAYFAHYLKLSDRLTLLNYAHFNWIHIFGTDNLTRDRRLFLGGDYTIRGFSEDSVGPVAADGRPAGGLILLSHTAELQVRLFDGIKLAAFVDSGSITNSFSGAGGIGRASFRHGAGLGLRYFTPIGPVRLDYGFKLDQQAGESLGHLHFAFGYAF